MLDRPTWRLDGLASQTGKVYDAVEAHSCVDTSSEIPAMSNTQLLINQLQDVSTRGSLSLVSS